MPVTSTSSAAIGAVESSLVDAAAAPRQGDEGGPDAWLVFDAGRGSGVPRPRQSVPRSWC